MLQGVTRQAQKCRSTGTPNFLQGVNRETRKRHHANAPASFIWCRDIIAAMLIQKRTKGRAAPWPQQCHMRLALPNQFNGVIEKTQQCHCRISPRGEPSNYRRDVSMVALSPLSLQGTLT